MSAGLLRVFQAAPPGRRFLVALLLLLPVGYFVSLAYALALGKAYSIEEFQYAHAAWLIAKGAQPYRDFFDPHFPLVYQLMSVASRLLGDDPNQIRGFRTWMLPFLAMTALSCQLLNRRRDQGWAWLAPLLLLSTTTLLYRATEIRPDPLAFSFFSLALAVHFVPQIKPERRGFLSGAFLVMSVWGTQKVIYYGVGFALAFLVDVFYNQRRGQAALLGSPMHFLLGAGMAALPIVGWLVTAGTAGPWFYWCLSWAAEHQSHYPGFPFTQSFVPFLKVEGWLFLPAAVGGLSTLLSWWHHPRRSSHPDLLLMLALPTTFMSYAVQSGPFVYSLLPFIGVLCVFAARGVTDLLRLIDALRQQQAGLGAALYLVLAGGLGYQLHLGAARIHERLAETSNQYQHKTFNLIRQLTAPTDCAYDNSGGYVSRPSAHFFFYTDELIRKQEAKLLNREIPAGIESRGCVLNLVDLRQKRLPQPLRDYLAQNFQPYNGDIRLWGRHYAPDGGRTGRFLATRTDEYFVSDPALVQAGLLIDGKAIENQIFRLEKGWHSLEWTDPQADFYLLWLPADGKPYRPQPQAKPRFSHLL